MSPEFYKTLKNGNSSNWLSPAPPIVCIPVYENNVWVLIVVITTEDKTKIFYFHDMGKEAAKGIGLFIQSSGSINVSTKGIDIISRRFNDSTYGLAMIGTFMEIIKLIDGHEDCELIKAIKHNAFDQNISHGDVKDDIQDTFGEILYHQSYWAKYSSGSDEMWWPCRRISSRLAKKLIRFQKLQT